MDLQKLSNLSLCQMNFIAQNPESSQAKLSNEVLSLASRLRKVRNDVAEPSEIYLTIVVTLIRTLLYAVESHEIEAVLTAAGLDLKVKSAGAN